MASQFSLTRRNGYLIGHIQGDPATDKERRSYFARMLDEAISGNLDFIFHEDTPGAKPRTAAEYINRAQALGATSFSKRIAYVHPGFSANTCELMENAAWNWGKKVRMFSHLDDAIRWIEDREDDTA